MRHYKHFYHYFLRYQEQEQLGQLIILRALSDRVSEINSQDAYCSLKHVYLECHPHQRFHDSDYELLQKYYRVLAKDYYPYRMAAKMFSSRLGSINGSGVPWFHSCRLAPDICALV